MPRRQKREPDISAIADRIVEILGNQKLTRSTGRSHPRRQIDCGANIVAFAVQDAAVMRTDMQCRELRLCVNETFHRKAEFDRVRRFRERQHERIADLLRNSAYMSSRATPYGIAEPAQYIGSRLITHRCGQRCEASQIDKEHGRLLQAGCRCWGSGVFGEMAEQILADGSLIGPTVKADDAGSTSSFSGLPTRRLASSSSVPTSP